MSALEALKAKRSSKASSSNSSVPPVKHILSSPPAQILAPASSPAPGRARVQQGSPTGPGSKHFPSAAGRTYNQAILGDDHTGSLNKRNKEGMKVDKDGGSWGASLSKPSASTTPTMGSSPPEGASSLGSNMERGLDGQAPRKRAMVSREGSEYASSTGGIGNSLSAVKVDSRPVTPGNLSRNSSSDQVMAGTSQGSMPSTPIGSFQKSRFKVRPAPGGPTGSPGTPSVQKFKTLFPTLAVEKIEQLIIDHGDEPSVNLVKRMSALSQGKTFTPPKIGGSVGGRLIDRQNSGGMVSPPNNGALSNGKQSHGKIIRVAPMPSPQSLKMEEKKKSAIYSNRRTENQSSGSRRSPIEVGEKRRRDVGSDSEADWSDASTGKGKKGKRNYGVEMEDMDETNALNVFNTCDAAQLTGTIVCSDEQAKIIIALRPYDNVDELRRKLQKKKGVSQGLFDQYMEVMQGYIDVDRCLNKCESIGKELLDVMRVWGGTAKQENGGSRASSPTGTSQVSNVVSSQDTGMHIATVDAQRLKRMAQQETDPKKRKIAKLYRDAQPEGLAEDAKLKDYQTVGVNWLTMMYERQLSCILADEMGLGKTFQVIAFLAGLKAKGKKMSHLILVPSSTLENWVREFARFAPSIDVQCYYGSQKERDEQRYQLKEQYRAGDLEVLLTTYDLAFREQDHKFLKKKLDFECCIYDEGHTLKNFNSLRYTRLIEIQPKWRLLLTGTPLQNNLQELVSLLKFIHEDIFEDAETSLRQIFKVHAKGASNLLSQQRVSRARTMMTPFVLRRRKAQVLKDLPDKTETKVICKMDSDQSKLYSDILERSRTVLATQTEEELEKLALEDEDEEAKAKTKAKAKKALAKHKENASSNILMDLRKAAIHPLLFRRLYTDAIIRKMARDCMKEEQFMDSVYDLIVEDMEVMTDSELCGFSKEHKSCNQYIKHADDAFMKSAKVAMLLEKLEQCKREGRRMLLFSQFTQVLNILEIVLEKLDTRFLRLDGSTKVDERQGMVDEFTEDEEIKVFLLSTRAGGMGINLVAASMVVIFDQDFNPHNDKQAMDRAYRIGQTRDVLVYKFITEDTIEDNMYALGETKLRLDNAVGGSGVPLDADGKPQDQQTTNETKKSLMKAIRQKVVDTPGHATVKTEEDVSMSVDAA